jgi:hypothetical protein
MTSTCPRCRTGVVASGGAGLCERCAIPDLHARLVRWHDPDLWCCCAYADRAAIRATPYGACPLCDKALTPYKTYAETMRRSREKVVDPAAWGGHGTGLSGALARGARAWRHRL